MLGREGRERIESQRRGRKESSCGEKTGMRLAMIMMVTRTQIALSVLCAHFVSHDGEHES
jgi:hypothetical protein